MTSRNGNPRWFAVSLQALVFLEQSDHVCPSAVLADQVQSHAVFMRRVLAQLARAGLVEAREGREGGYRLARAAADITLADVYRGLAAAPAAAELPVVAHSHGPAPEPALWAVLNGIFGEAEELMLGVLARYTLADLSHEVTRLRAGQPDGWPQSTELDTATV